MSEHEQVIRSTLNRLYQRIERPSAADAAAHRIALLAVAELTKAPTEPASKRLRSSPEAEPAPKAGEAYYETLSAKAVTEAVEGGLMTAAEALALEEAGKQRVKLTAWLREQINEAVE